MYWLKSIEQQAHRKLSSESYSSLTEEQKKEVRFKIRYIPVWACKEIQEKHPGVDISLESVLMLSTVSLEETMRQFPTRAPYISLFDYRYMISQELRDKIERKAEREAQAGVIAWVVFGILVAFLLYGLFMGALYLQNQVSGMPSDEVPGAAILAIVFLLIVVMAMGGPKRI
jgi:hypothetical protein